MPLDLGFIELVSIGEMPEPMRLRVEGWGVWEPLSAQPETKPSGFLNGILSVS